ncbi:MAG: hypothetical protein QXM69_08970 [Sulfolobaceae archaeon]
MKGLVSPVVVMILVTAVLFAMLAVFFLYSFYFTNTSTSASSQSYIIGLSKLVQFQISTFAFRGIQPSNNYFNVSYLISVSAPVKAVTVVVFNATPMPLSQLYYYKPSLQSTSKSGLFISQGLNYQSLRPFILTSQVFLPTGDLLGTVSVMAYNITTNSTYVLSSVISPKNIVVIWVLYNYFGKWYRLVYTYTSPISQGVGNYIVIGTGTYAQANPPGAKPPHYVTTQTGDSFGLWFKELNPGVNSIILNLTYISTSAGGTNVTILIYQKAGSLYCNISTISKNGITRLLPPKLILSNLIQGQWYFMNISTGSHLGLSQEFNISIYSSSRYLNSSLISDNSIPQLNGYNITVKFGSSLTAAVGISQAYFVALQSNNPSSKTAFYNVSRNVFSNGYYFNNTKNLQWIISNANNQLYSIIYWYFVVPYNPPPPTIPAIMWYWPTQGNMNLQMVYIPEVGSNTYIIG